MRCELISSTRDAQGLVGDLRGLIPSGGTVSDAVSEIIDAVRTRGDEAVLEYTRRFDTAGPPRPLAVPNDQVLAAGAALSPELVRALELSIANLEKAAEAALESDRVVRLDGSEVIVREAPVRRAGVYVPSGRSPYPSTVVMGVVTAVVAGVDEVVVCAPPGPDGEVDQIVLGACALTSRYEVYRMGGAQAIAALAYGTETVRPVDVIVGPGNLYVQEAKRQVSGQVGIDSFAGPSDLLVIADSDADPEPVALDLLAQAEHGDGTLVMAASTDRALLEALRRRVEPAAETGAVCCLIELADDGSAWELAQAFAPEHLQLIGSRAEQLAETVTTAGCVFVGPEAGTAFGDYVAGSNHILPTGGSGHFASALSPRAFRRTFTQVRVTDAAMLARAAAPLARAEGFEQHARSMEARIRENHRR